MIDKYIWVNDIEAWTVAVITGQPADEIVRIYGGDPTSPVGDVNAFGMLVEAIDGKITAYFESLYPISAEPPQPDEVRPSWSIGPETEPELARQTCFALMEQQTGLAFNQLWLARMLPTYRIPDPHELFKDVETARQP